MSESPETPTPLPDRSELEGLLTRHLEAMHSYVEMRLGKDLRTRENVSDIVQSAAREILHNPGQFRYQGEHAFRAFLARVIDNKINNKARKLRAIKHAGEELVSSFEHLSLAYSGSTPSEDAMSREELERLRAAIDELGEEERRLLSLHKILDLPMAQIARDLGEPETTVRSRMARILAQVAVRMGGSTSV